MKQYNLIPSSYQSKFTIFFFCYITCVLSGYAQSSIPNAGFESWNTRTLYQEFPPYGTSNLFGFFSGVSDFVNAIPVPGCSSPQAIRIENISLGQDIQVGTLSVGTFGSQIFGGLSYSEQPDSLYLTLRYEIAPGDEGLIAMFFSRTDSSTVSSFFHTLTDSQTTCTTIGFDLSFSGIPDSVAFLVSSGSLSGTPVAGGWVEIDSIYFSGNVSQLPNSGFEVTEPLNIYDPTDWLSANDILSVLNGTTNFPMAEEETDVVYDGNSALRLVSRRVKHDSSVVGFIINGQQFLNDAVGGQPYHGPNLDTLFGYYQYQPVGNDTGSVFLRFTRYEPQADSTIVILETGMKLSEALSYSQFAVPFNLTQMADSFMIGFSSSDADRIFSSAEPGFGSILRIDALSFGSQSVAIQPLFEQATYQLYPNPSSKEIFLKFDPIIGQIYSLRLFSLDGKTVLAHDIPPSFDQSSMTVHISLQDLAKGAYFLSLVNEQGDLILSDKIIKQ